jgi:hypothetical protein
MYWSQKQKEEGMKRRKRVEGCMKFCQMCDPLIYCATLIWKKVFARKTRRGGDENKE